MTAGLRRKRMVIRERQEERIGMRNKRQEEKLGMRSQGQEEKIVLKKTIPAKERGKKEGMRTASTL